MTNISRRTFLKTTAYTLGSLLMSACAKEQAVESNPWDFLSIRHAKIESIGDFLKRSTPITERQNEYIGPALFEKARQRLGPAIMEEAEKRKFTAVEITAEHEIRVVPEAIVPATHLRDYAIKAIDYMCEQLPQIQLPRIDWRITRAKDPITDPSFVICNAFDEVVYAKCKDVSGREFEIAMGNGLEAGGFSYFTDRFRAAVITSGTDGLMNPFSEVIPLATYAVDRAYFGEVVSEEDLTMSEAVQEGLSYHLARELAKKLNIPNGEQIVNTLRDNLKKNPKYCLVQASIDWITKHGKKEALKLYLSEGPREYKKAITKSN